MRRLLGCLVGLLLAGVAGLAQSPLPPPSPSPTLPAPVPVSPAPPPPSPRGELGQALERLKSAREELQREREQFSKFAAAVPVDEAARTQLLLRLGSLLHQLEAKKSAPPPPPSKSAPPPPTEMPPTSVKPAPPPAAPAAPPSDPLALAQLQFRAGQLDRALTTLRGMRSQDLTARDRVWSQYLVACCLRRQGKLSEASAIYREVAGNRADPFLADSAVWQLGFLRWREEMQAGLARAREQAP